MARYDTLREFLRGAGIRHVLMAGSAATAAHGRRQHCNILFSPLRPCYRSWFYVFLETTMSNVTMSDISHLRRFFGRFLGRRLLRTLSRYAADMCLISTMAGYQNLSKDFNCFVAS